MRAYDLVVEYLKTGRYEVINGVRVYHEERIVAIEDNKFYLVVQAHIEDAWRELINMVKENPGYLKAVVEHIEKAGSGVLPSIISIMRIKKEDLV